MTIETTHTGLRQIRLHSPGLIAPLLSQTVFGPEKEIDPEHILIGGTNLLKRNDVSELIHILEHWYETGELALNQSELRITPANP